MQLSVIFVVVALPVQLTDTPFDVPPSVNVPSAATLPVKPAKAPLVVTSHPV
jgi:predicted dienelactone hydrolase